GVGLRDRSDSRSDPLLKPCLAQDLFGERRSNSCLNAFVQLGIEYGRRRDQLFIVGHLAIEPFDELWRRHRVQFDAMGLQPVGPFVWHIIRDGLAPLLLFYLLDLQSHLDRLPRFEAEVDDRDLAGTARLGFLLQRLVDGGAEGVRIVNAEHSDRLVMLDELVDQVACGSRGEPLRRHDRAIVLLAPMLVLEHFREAFLLDVEQLVEAPRRPLVALDHECAERERLAPVRMVDRATRGRWRRLRVMTVSLPREARTAPATTRSPLPSAPRVGRRYSLDDPIRRPTLKRPATSSCST